jgi:hypothetical protein
MRTRAVVGAVGLALPLTACGAAAAQTATRSPRHAQLERCHLRAESRGHTDPVNEHVSRLTRIGAAREREPNPSTAYVGYEAHSPLERAPS